MLWHQESILSSGLDRLTGWGDIAEMQLSVRTGDSMTLRRNVLRQLLAKNSLDGEVIALVNAQRWTLTKILHRVLLEFRNSETLSCNSHAFASFACALISTKYEFCSKPSLHKRRIFGSGRSLSGVLRSKTTPGNHDGLSTGIGFIGYSTQHAPLTRC